MTEYRLEMKDVSKQFGEVKALRDIDFEVGPNEVVGLVGDNGAGKSTLIKIVTGYYQPDSGELYFNGEKVEDRPVTIPDLVATICKAVGLDPMKQNISNVGRPIRLADPEAKPIDEILA